VLDVRGLTLDLTLEGRPPVPVVSDVTFAVSKGEILGIVGESGSGKSLTAMSVMGMLPAAAHVSSGSIRYCGQELLAMPARELGRLRGDRIGMIFQDPLAFLNPLMTVGQQITEALVLHGASKESAKARALELLETVGVRNAAQRIGDYPHQFSGGMRQRVIIAIAVANNPSLLIADEPTTALDVTVQAEILRLLKRLRDELGAALVLITHDIGIVEEVCDSVAVMYAGRIVEHGPAAEVLTRPRHPYTRELMRSTPRLKVDGQTRLPAIPGQPPDVTRRPSGCPFHPRCPLATERCSVEDPALVDLGASRPHRVACWAADQVPPVTTSARVVERTEDREERQIILDVRDVRLGYRSRSRLFHRADTHFAVDGVSLRAYRGHALGLVGESGCGKSTLARAIVGLIEPADGEIEIDGKQWKSASAHERSVLRRTVQMVFQDPYSSLNPRQTVRTILTEPLVVHGLYDGRSRGKRVEELLGLVGLSNSLLDRYPYQLSGGQRQRVGIARALTVEPKLIVADEPVSALDVSVQAQVINLLADLRDELGLGFLFIAHDLSVVRHLCDEVAVMQVGHIVEHAQTETVFTDPQHPYTRSLLAAAPGATFTPENDAPVDLLPSEEGR
jgi:peptide/nickel transport system ATP-binding protein